MENNMQVNITNDVEFTDGNTNLIKLLEMFEIVNSSRGQLDNTGVITMFVNVSPHLAHFLLKRNFGNRGLSKKNLNHLVSEMKKGNWQFDGQPLRFDDKGKLLDGQHRLTSIIKTGLTVPFVIVLGLNSEVFKTMDTGKSRNGSDTFKIANIPNSKNAATMTQFIYKFDRGLFGFSSQKDNLSNTALLEHYYTLPNLQNSIKVAHKLYKSGDNLVGLNILGSFHYLISISNPIMADEFITKLATGLNIEEKSPILALRKKLINSKMDRNNSFTYQSLLEHISYAWGKFLNNQKVSRLQIPINYKISI